MPYKLYFGYGMNIYSDHNWEGLIPLKTEKTDHATIIIHTRKRDKTYMPPGFAREISVDLDGQIIGLNERGTGQFYAFNGRKLEVTLRSRLTKEDEKEFFKTGMASLMHQLGLMVLHGAELIVNQKGFLLTGETTLKNRVTETLHACGASFLAETLSVISWEEDIPVIIPSYPGESGRQNTEEAELYFNSHTVLSSIIHFRHGSGQTLVKLSKFEAFKRIFHAYYLNIDSRLEKLITDHFRNAEKLLNTIEVYETSPPENTEAVKTLLYQMKLI